MKLPLKPGYSLGVAQGPKAATKKQYFVDDARRQQRLSSGFRGVFDRITGKKRIKARNEREAF